MLVVLLVLLMAVPAKADGLARRAFERSQRATTLAAKARGMAVPTPPKVRYVNETPPGWEGSFKGRAASDGDTIYSQGADRYSIRHERGHLFDAQVLNDDDRAFFTRLMGLEGPWTQDTTTELGQMAGGGRSPDEWFADWYANGNRGAPNGPSGRWTQGYADSPLSDRQYRRFLMRVQRASRRYGAPSGQ